LSAQVEWLGHSFRSTTATEVVLEAYGEWGCESFLRFNGMFGLAIWDKKRQRLILARDRYGIKPLYYFLADETLLFASEIKAFLAHPAFRVSMDKEGLLEYMTFQNFFTDKTLFRGVYILPAGTYLEVSLRKKTELRPKRYWDYCFAEPKEPLDPAEYAHELERLFC